MRADRPSAHSLRIAGLYAAFAATWILFSDQAVAWLFRDPAALTTAATVKGWFFVAVTATLLFVTVRRQLTEVERIATAHREAEERYRFLADNVADVLWVYDLQTQRFTYVSPSIEKLRGYTPEEVMARPLAHALTPASLAFVNAELPRRFEAFQAGDPTALTRTYDIEQIRRDGSSVWTEVVTTYRRNERGGIDMIGTTRDISERRRVQQSLRENEARLHRAEEISGLGHWTANLTSGELIASAGAQRIYGLTDGRLPFATVKELPLPEYRARLDAAMEALIERDQPYDVEFRIRRSTDGQFVDIHSLAEYDRGNRVVFGTIQDITERKLELAQLASSEAKFRTLVSNAPVVLFQIGADGRFRISEGKGLEKLGLKPGQVVGHSAYDVYRDAPLVCDQIRRALAGNIVQESLPLGELSYDIVYHPLRDAGGVVTDIIGLAVDVTERRRAEELLRLGNAALAAAANAIALTDRAGRIVWINPAFTALTGYGSEESLGRTLGQLLNSGKHDRDFFRELWDTILAGQPWRGEMSNRRKDGTLYTEEQTITPVRNQRGEIANFVAIKQDVTGRKALEAQVLRSQRLESVGRLAGGIAHDLNNILVPVLMAPTVLRDAITDPSVLPVLDAVETSAKRGASIIRQLLTFSRGGAAEGEKVLVQLRHIVRDMVMIMRETFPKNIVVHSELAADPWLIEADATQLHQVLMNLCVNARDALPAGGTITLGLENTVLSEDFIAGTPGAAAGPHVLLTVADTGTGIAPEHLDKVFDPFFTTKEVGKGTGLGLSTVLGIVRGHHGFVQISSQLGRGTQFRVFLPASPSGAEAAAPAPDAPLARGRGELILLVDDEENVRKVTRRILERNGYRVVAADDGAEGFAWFQQHRREVAIVITDLLMPVMDGPTLIHALREIEPAVRIVAISGHEGDALQRLNPARDVSAFLSKPFAAATLLQTLHDVLGRPKELAPPTVN